MPGLHCSLIVHACVLLHVVDQLFADCSGDECEVYGAWPSSSRKQQIYDLIIYHPGLNTAVVIYVCLSLYVCNRDGRKACICL